MQIFNLLNIFIQVELYRTIEITKKYFDFIEAEKKNY